MATGLIQPFLFDFGNFLVVSLMGSLLHFFSVSLLLFLSISFSPTVCLDVLSLGYYQSRQAGGRKSLKQTLLSSFYLWIIFFLPFACLILCVRLCVFCLYVFIAERDMFTFSGNVCAPHSCNMIKGKNHVYVDTYVNDQVICATSVSSCVYECSCSFEVG